MDRRQLQFQLGEVGDSCDHQQAVRGLPKLLAAVTMPHIDGRAMLALHWTGTAWALCTGPSWSLNGGPKGRELDAAAAHALSAANSFTGTDWQDRFMAQLRSTLSTLRRKLEEQELRAHALRGEIRVLECQLAAAGLTEQPAAAIAQRLVGGWSGSAAELLATAADLADGMPES